MQTGTASLSRMISADRPKRHFPGQEYNPFMPKITFIGAGSTVFASQYVMHRDPRYWYDAERFDPLRWTADEIAKRPKFSYFPFSAGPRNCIGESFAWTEGILALATLAQRWRARLMPGLAVALEPMITLRPKHAIEMTLHRR